MPPVSSIKVGVRCRPLGYNELRDGCQSCVGFPEGGEQIVVGGSRQFSFDYVFSDRATQQEIYDRSVRSMIDNLFLGYNVTVLAYGQTGSGKTYTMGTDCRESVVVSMDTGIIPRTVWDIYRNLEGMRDSATVSVKVSFIEVYNEEIFDLLSHGKDVRTIREENQDVKIPGLIEESADTVDDVFRCLLKGSNNRAVGSTAMNETSSRSHAIFTMYFSIVPLVGCVDSQVESITSKLHLVDLAGSERASKTGATGDRFKEGVNINRGLLALGNVISSLVEKDRFKERNKHVPYRESKLTRLLQDSLGGNTKTLMLACISPADSNFEETATTLNYAARARMIQNKPVINKVNSAQSEIYQLRAQVTALKAQLKEGGHCGDRVTTGHEDNKTSLLLLSSQICELNTKMVTMQKERIQLLEEFDEEVTKKDELLKKVWEKLQREEEREKDDTYEELDRYIHEMIAKEEQEDMESAEQRPESMEGVEVAVEGAEAGTLKKSDYLKCLREELEMKEKRLENTEADLCLLRDYEEKNRELEQRIRELEEEKSRKSHHSRQEEVEVQLREARKQLAELQNLKREKDRKTEEVNQLRQKINELKTSIVKVTKDMHKEKASFRKIAADQEKQYKLLVNKDRRLQSQMERQAMQHAKETAVLRKKLESGAVTEKRLKELLENRKNFSMNRIARDNVSKNINSQVKLWIRQSLDQAAEVCETRQQVKRLIEKRRQLTEQQQLLSEEDDEMAGDIAGEIGRINECLALQQAQLSDSNSHDMQVVANWNQLRNINECRVAIKFMFKQLVEERVNNVMTDMELADLRVQSAALEELNGTLSSELACTRAQLEEQAHRALRRRRSTMVELPTQGEYSQEPSLKRKKVRESYRSDNNNSQQSSAFSETTNSVQSRRSSRTSQTCRCKSGCKPNRCGCMRWDTGCSRLCYCKGLCSSEKPEELSMVVELSDDKENLCDRTFDNLREVDEDVANTTFCVDKSPSANNNNTTINNNNTKTSYFPSISNQYPNQ